MHQSDLSFAPRIQPCSMELQTKVEDAKFEVPETDASIFGPSMATPATPPHATQSRLTKWFRIKKFVSKFLSLYTRFFKSRIRKIWSTWDWLLNLWAIRGDASGSAAAARLQSQPLCWSGWKSWIMFKKFQLALAQYWIIFSTNLKSLTKTTRWPLNTNLW